MKKEEGPEDGEKDGSSSKATVSLHASVERFLQAERCLRIDGNPQYSSSYNKYSNKLLVRRWYCTALEGSKVTTMREKWSKKDRWRAPKESSLLRHDDVFSVTHETRRQTGF